MSALAHLPGTPAISCSSLCRHIHSGRLPRKRGARRTPLRPCRASDYDNEPVDIDALASMLAAEAERRRREAAALDTAEPQGAAQPGPPPSTSGLGQRPFGYQVDARQADILRQLGDGGLLSSEFDLVQELGRISIQQQEDPGESPGGLPGSAVRSTREAVIAYTATFFTGMPFQDPVLTLLLEYLPEASEVALNELQILKHLTGMPRLEDKHFVASSVLTAYPPVVRLIGYFLAGQSAQGAQANADGLPHSGDVIYVVKKWDGLAPLALYPSAQQTSGFGLGKLFGAQDSGMSDRVRMLRAIARGCLSALAFCHERGVTHGSLGSGSVLLSTFDDRSAARLTAKLDNFGFGKRVAVAEDSSQPVTALASDDTPFGLGQKADLRALALVLLECLLSSLARSGPSAATSAEAVQRLLGDVFGYSVEEFRQYCRSEPEWEVAVALLEDREAAGWRLLEYLVEGTASAAELLESPFCKM